ncbi:hypothetical protein CFC21_094039 [Triticum aestivum]|uniref:DUF3741 domain-containing protein n=2 Tax=Triticum aestivum TaxID=4565 RepID=A0A9R1LM92_WHEAT|nr:uncharacterized protein LOC109759921 isoform X2 [Aegilops tauschii subsp. strangulata]XP_044421206.1 uncharacterized protein LOC123145779 isoform X1 [Triticum aestivum]KAF7091463.1 hypothetical protein CFC21_094039 [Triticum aestivum]
MTPRDGAVDLWAMAAELERQFAGYKQRLASSGRISSLVADDDAHVLVLAAAPDDDRVEEEEEEYAAVGGVRGRMYEAYTRRRDERLRSVWRARMERKEAEVMALWAQLDARGGGGPAAAEDVDGAAGEEAEDGGERRRSSDVAAPGMVSGKKHPRTRRSFSSANLVKSTRPDVGIRRAVSQEPPEPPAGTDDGAGRKHGHRARPVTGAAPKRKALSGSKGASAKGHGSVRQSGPKPKPPRSFPRPSSSGGMEGVREAALPQNGNVASSPRPFLASDNGTGTQNARAASPASDGGEVVDSAAPAVDGDEPEAKNGEITGDPERRDAEEIVVRSPEAKLGNGEITSDSETEPSYVFIKKKAVVEEEEAARLSDALAGPRSEEPHIQVRNGTDDADEAPTAANAEEAPGRGSSDSVSSMSGRVSAPSSPPSCSSRAKSIERLLVEDAALLRKRREDQSATGGRSVPAVSTPGSAGRRAYGAAPTTSPRGTAMGFKKRFLSFGKKNRGSREGATTVIVDCTSPAIDDDDGASERWRTAADSIRPRVLGSSSDAASDDTDQYAASPQACSLQILVAAASPAKSELSEIVPSEKSPKAHRSFFSLRSFNCGRS